MARREIEYVATLSKDALDRRGNIELRRNQHGETYFATYYKGRYTTWHLYFTGDDWLRLHGYKVGDKIDLSVAMHLYEHGMSHTGGSRRRSTVSAFRR